MSTSLNTGSTYNNRIVYLDIPDTRFATAFLDTQYMKYAVDGECLQDKATGEIYLRRKSDGRLISFNQNYKEISQLMFELKALEANNSAFYHPTKRVSLLDAYDTVDPGALVYVENIDISEVNNHQLFNVVGEYNGNSGDKQTLEFEPSALNKKISFNISPKSNGFFINLHTRIVDIAAIEYLSIDSNGINLDYAPWLTYKIKLKTESNGNLEYTIEQALPLNNSTAVIFPTTVLPDEKIKVYDTDGSRINTSIFYDIRTFYDYQNDSVLFDDLSIIEVEILKFDFTNIRRSFDEKIVLNPDPVSLQNTHRHFYPTIDPDNDHEIFLTHATITAYIDNMDNIIYNDNEFIVSVLDLDAVERWADSTAREQIPGIYTSIYRPNVMSPNSLWAERIIDISMSTGKSEATGADSRLNNLKNALSGYVVTTGDPIKTIVEGGGD